MKHYTLWLCALLALAGCAPHGGRIDRQALVGRNNPRVTDLDSLHALTLGNGEFAVTVDATGLQTFPERYSRGLSLGTYSEWGWHSSPNPEGYTHAETLEDHPLPGHPHGIYSVQRGYAQPERSQAASAWLRANPQRLHLGNIGFADLQAEALTDIDQQLDMWNGTIHARFRHRGVRVEVESVVSGEADCFAAQIRSDEALPIAFRFPYPSGGHTDDGSVWDADSLHSTEILRTEAHGALVERRIDESVYYVVIGWSGEAQLRQTGRNTLILTPAAGNWSFSATFAPEPPTRPAATFADAATAAGRLWNDYWQTGAVVDFSHCTNAAAPMLERRVVQSQYLIRVQEAQHFPPAETGLTYNSWHGKFHLEMVMWHSFHYALWNHPELLEKQLRWYKTVLPTARGIAERQGFRGVRWMKMTDPSGLEAPSDIGSYLLWQQPHPIYMAELIYRTRPEADVLDEYGELVELSAEFLADFVTYDAERKRYMIEGACGANESYNEQKTVNPAFELSYLHFGLTVAQQWRERRGEPRNDQWDRILAELSPLAASPDGIYLPAERGPGIPDFERGTTEITVASSFTAPAGGFVDAQRPQEMTRTVHIEAYRDTPDRDNPFYSKGTSSENLLAYGMLPACRLFTTEQMRATADRASENWRYSSNWSWNSCAFAMNAARTGRSDTAVRVITMDGHTENVLPSGNNYRSETLRMYLPGNGGLLLAIGAMCAGWDGCEEVNPGFPKDGTWDVRWEGLSPLP